MPQYRRPLQPGGTFFFTIVTHTRAPFLCDEPARLALHEVIADVGRRRPFELQAIVLLPDHFHPLITLPTNDTDFSTRLASIKANFTRQWLNGGGKEVGQSTSRSNHGHRAVWQKRFWDHCIRDEEDLANHLDYIHYNPVKHGLSVVPISGLGQHSKNGLPVASINPTGCVFAGVARQLLPRSRDLKITRWNRKPV